MWLHSKLRAPPEPDAEFIANLGLQQAGVSLTYNNEAFRSNLGGILKVADAGLATNAQLILNPVNPDDVRIDAALAVQNINIRQQLYIFPTALRLEAQTAFTLCVWTARQDCSRKPPRCLWLRRRATSIS